MILFTPTGQLRAVWRLAIFLGSSYALTVALSGVMRFVWGDALYNPMFRWWAMVAQLWTLVLALVGAHWLCIRFIDRQAWSVFGMGRHAWRVWPMGLAALLGGAAVAVPTLLLLVARQFVFMPGDDGSWVGAAVRITLFLIPAALWEELLFRGYPFAVLREAIGWKWALCITSIMFGLAHAQNSGIGVQNFVIVVLAGVLLGMVVLIAKSVYAAWIAHLFWNWVMAVLFHASVSGNPFERPGYEMVEQGPDWLTGGIWGPEGGAATAVGLFAAVVYVYHRYLRRSEGETLVLRRP